MSSKFRAVVLLASFAENLPPLGEPTTSHHLLGEPRLLATNIVTAIPFRVDVKKWSNLAPKTNHQTKTKPHYSTELKPLTQGVDLVIVK